MEEAVADGLKRLLGPAVEKDVLADLKERSDAGAVEIFAKNLGDLLLAAPLDAKCGDRTLIATDRSSELSNAFNTTPIPPLPITRSTLKRPKLPIALAPVAHAVVSRTTCSPRVSVDAGWWSITTTARI